MFIKTFEVILYSIFISVKMYTHMKNLIKLYKSYTAFYIFFDKVKQGIVFWLKKEDGANDGDF